MDVEFDPDKRAWTLAWRGLDFARAGDVFTGFHLTQSDDRREYREVRFVTVGELDGRVVVLVWTPRASAVRVISLRKANDREKTNFVHRTGRSG